VKCAVCQGEIRDAQYANAWESSLKLHACCSRECCARFDPDAHWFPNHPPTALDDVAAAAVMEQGKFRIQQGDSPRIVARDLLIAGLAPWMVRRSLLGAAAAAVASDRATSGGSLLGAISALLFGQGLLVGDRNRGMTDASEALDGSAQVDAWETHFGLPPS
jgi:hypothetical protein